MLLTGARGTGKSSLITALLGKYAGPGLRLIDVEIHFLFFFTDTATPEIYTLSLHDALPISGHWAPLRWWSLRAGTDRARAVIGNAHRQPRSDRKSTRLNSSHSSISYAVFCLKKKTCCSPALAAPGSPRSSRRCSASTPALACG